MRHGHERLWHWFFLSRASFCVLPRVLMHAMPDEWQDKMAALLEEYDKAFDLGELPGCRVMAVDPERHSKFVSWPDWILNYRHPDERQISMRRAANHAEVREQV